MSVHESASYWVSVILQGEEDIIRVHTEFVDVLLKFVHPGSIGLDLTGIQVLTESSVM